MSVSLKDLARIGAGLAIGRWFAGGVVGAGRLETNMRGVATVVGEVVANDI